MAADIERNPPAFAVHTGRAANGPRTLMIGGLYLLAVLNGLAADVVNSIRSEPFWSALNTTFGISVVSVGAVVCGLMLVRRSSVREIVWADAVLATIVVLLLLLPHRATSWGAVTLLAIYELSRPRALGLDRAGAAIFLALAASEFWAPVVIQAFGNLWLSWDAALVAALLRVFVTDEVIRTGNLVSMPDGSSIALVVGCASLTNVAYGLLCWLVIAKGIRPTWTTLDIAAAAALAGSVVALNVGRVAMMTIDAERYALLHGALGADAFNIILLAVSGAAAIWTVQYASPEMGSRGSAVGTH